MARRDELRVLRENAGLSLSELGQRVGGASKWTVHRWETGEARPRGKWWPRLAEALEISEQELRRILNGTLDVPLLEQRAAAKQALGLTDYSKSQADPSAWLRRLVDFHDIPDDGPVRPLPELEHDIRRVVHARVNSKYQLVASLLPDLMPELTRAVGQARGAADQQHVWRWLVQAWRAADAVADKNGWVSLSSAIIAVMRQAANQAEDPLAIAVGDYVRAQTFFVHGEHAKGRRELTRAAAQLNAGASAETMACYGALHMRAAVLAARGHGRRDQIEDHLAEAREAARYVGEDGVFLGTAFGPDTVRIHEITLALDLSEPASALASAAGWQPGEHVPAERRSHFYVDLARAQTALERPESALNALEQACRIAPEHIRADPGIPRLLAAIAGNEAGMTEEVRRFARTLRLAVPAPSLPGWCEDVGQRGE